MNYLQQIVNFENWLDVNHLSPNAQVLWHRLMGLFNKTGFKKRINISNQRLMARTCISREATFIKARNDLVSAGLLIYIKGSKGHPGTYEMNTSGFYAWPKNHTSDSVQNPVKIQSVFASGESNLLTDSHLLNSTDIDNVTFKEANSEEYNEPDLEVQYEGQTADIYKQDKTNKDEINEISLSGNSLKNPVSLVNIKPHVCERDYNNLLESFSANIRKPTPNDKSTLITLLQKYKLPTILCAVDRSRDSGGSAKYIETVIENAMRKSSASLTPYQTNHKPTYDLDDYDLQDDLLRLKN